MEINSEFWPFVTAHLEDEPSTLRLRFHGKGVPELDIDAAILQVECRRRYRNKFCRTLTRDEEFYFPTRLVAEQSTSDLLAAFHGRLARGCNRAADFTAGLGIDTWHIAFETGCSMIAAIEMLPPLAEALDFNLPRLTEGNFNVICDDCRNVLDRTSEGEYDLIFIDPARRSADGQRVYGISDCQPDIKAMLGQLRKKCKKTLVKLSPMLDITAVSRELDCREIYAVGTATECKELLAVVTGDRRVSLSSPNKPITENSIKISAVTLQENEEPLIFSFRREEELSTPAPGATPRSGDIILEPYPSVQKAGASGCLCHTYGLKKIASNTQLYFYNGKGTDDSCPNLPGESFTILEIIPYSSGEIKRLHKRYPRAQVTTRNFRVPASTLEKKLKISQGDEIRIFAVTLADGQPVMIVTQRG